MTSCLTNRDPQELRQTDFMSIIPFERHIDPLMTKSPFLRGIRGPGFIGEPKTKPTGDDEEEYDEMPKRAQRIIDRPKRISMTSPRPYTPVLPLPVNDQEVRSLPGPSRLGGQAAHNSGTPPSSTLRPQTSTPAYQPPLRGNLKNQTVVEIMGGPQYMDLIAERELLPVNTGMFEDMYLQVSK